MHLHAERCSASICADFELIAFYQCRNLKPGKPSALHPSKADAQDMGDNGWRVMLKRDECREEVAFRNLFKAGDILKLQEADVRDAPLSHVFCGDRQMLIGDVDANDLSCRFGKVSCQSTDSTAQFDDLGDLAQVKAGSREVGLYDCDIIFPGSVKLYARGIIQHL